MLKTEQLREGERLKRLYVFGNEYLEGDSFSYVIAQELKDCVDIVYCRSPEELIDVEGEILILDVVKGISEPLLIEDCSVLKTKKIISLHDFDLGFFLSLLKEMGEKKKVKIIGIPMQGDVEKIVKRVKEWI